MNYWSNLSDRNQLSELRILYIHFTLGTLSMELTAGVPVPPLTLYLEVKLLLLISSIEH